MHATVTFATAIPAAIHLDCARIVGRITMRANQFLVNLQFIGSKLWQWQAVLVVSRVAIVAQQYQVFGDVGAAVRLVLQVMIFEAAMISFACVRAAPADATV